MRESDIRDLSMVERFFKSEDEWLTQFVHNGSTVDEKYTVDVPCPCCGEHDGDKLFVKQYFCFEQCPECGTIYVNQRFNEERLNSYYATRESRLNYHNVLSANSNEEYRINSIFLPRVGYIREVMRSAGADFGADQQLLDIGCASGQFLTCLQSLENSPKLFGAEASGDLAAIAKLKIPNAEIIGSPFRSEDFRSQAMDIVTVWEVIEHVFDPYAFLKDVAEVIRPGGHLFLSVPNIEGFDIQILWDGGNAFSPPSHLNYFRKSSINRLLERVGLKVVDIATPGKLDVDIVRNRIKANSEAQGRLGGYFTKAFLSDSVEDATLCEKLQEIIRLSGLSSHMIISCRKL
jgi:SAM-dependent methyltransferase